MDVLKGFKGFCLCFIIGVRISLQVTCIADGKPPWVPLPPLSPILTGLAPGSLNPCHFYDYNNFTSCLVNGLFQMLRMSLVRKKSDWFRMISLLWGQLWIWVSKSLTIFTSACLSIGLGILLAEVEECILGRKPPNNLILFQGLWLQWDDLRDLGTASVGKEAGRFSRLFIWKVKTCIGCRR